MGKEPYVMVINKSGLMNNLYYAASKIGINLVGKGDPRAQALITYTDLRSAAKDVFAFKAKHLPVLMVQHGRRAMEEYVSDDWFQARKTLVADKVCVWGTYDYERITSVVDKSRVVLTGNPSFDSCLNRDEIQDREVLLKEFSIPKDKKIILYAVPMFGGDSLSDQLFHYTFTVLDAIINTCKVYPELYKDYIIVLKGLQTNRRAIPEWEKYSKMGLPVILTKTRGDWSHLLTITRLANCCSMLFGTQDPLLFGMIFGKPILDLLSYENLKVKAYTKNMHKLSKYMFQYMALGQQQEKQKVDYTDILSCEAGPLDGNSSERVLKIIKEMLL